MISNKQVDIIIPVYREHENITHTLHAIGEDLQTPYQVTLVYDADDDPTLPVARGAVEDLRLPVNLIKNQYGCGVLNAIKTGFAATQGEYVVVMMADLSDPPAVINTMVASAERERLDVVCASRYMHGGSQKGGPFLKRSLSRAAGISLYHFAGLPTHDATNSFKLYRRSFLNQIEIESQKGFEFGLEIVVKAYGLSKKIGETPTTWRERTAGTSQFRFVAWLPAYLRWYLFGYGQSLKHFAKALTKKFEI
jgi:glycosyltransferase involved in cell wall biosynthesis